jgi:aspartyl protease family protein
MDAGKYLAAILLAMTTGVAAAAAVGDVKVIALFAGKALLQVGEQRKIVADGETFEGVTLKSATGRGAVVVIDGEEIEVDLNRSIAGTYKKRNNVSLKIYPDSIGMYYADGKINGQSTRFLVDTGATYVTMSGRYARSLDIDYTRGRQSAAQTASAIVPVWQIQLDSVSVGGITVRNVTATVIVGDKPFDVLLGNSFLEHTHMQKAGSVLELKKRF